MKKITLLPSRPNHFYNAQGNAKRNGAAVIINCRMQVDLTYKSTTRFLT